MFDLIKEAMASGVMIARYIPYCNKYTLRVDEIFMF